MHLCCEAVAVTASVALATWAVRLVPWRSRGTVFRDVPMGPCSERQVHLCCEAVVATAEKQGAPTGPSQSEAVAAAAEKQDAMASTGPCLGGPRAVQTRTQL